MPRDDIFDTGHAYGRSDTESLSTYFPLGFTTDSTDFAYENGFHPSNNGAGWLEDVYPTAANRSAAPPLASNGLGNVDGTHFDRYSHSARRQQQHQFALLATPQSSNNSRGGHSRTPNHRSSFSQSIPTPPDITVDAPSDQLGFRDEAEAIPTKGSAQRAVEQSPLSGVRLEVHSSNQRKTTTHSGAQKQERAVAPIESNKHLSSDPARNKSSLNEQGESPPRSGMVWSGMSVRDEDGQKETPSRGKAGSLASSAQSAQSRSSFNFSRLDRLSESPNVPGVLRLGQRSASQNGQRSLPDEKGFSIQIGSKLFKLSGASIMSDAPSYFSAFFIDQLEQNDDRTGGVRTLFIDRDPETFRDIARHLQGYLVTPTDGSHFVKLFADAQFYRLPRLQSQLFESEIFVEVGNEHFRIPRDIFSSPGDTPNYFTLGFTVFFSAPGDAFPGLNPRGLLRPPAIHPPQIPNRSPKIFADILHLLRGYPLTIQNSDHRAQLLKDARYYNLRGLEQRLIPYSVTRNIDRQVSEIGIRLQDIKPSQISLAFDSSSSSSSSTHSLPPRSPSPNQSAYITYARPFTDETAHHLILEVPSSSSSAEPLSLNTSTMRATLFGTTKARITALFQTIANKLNLPTTMPLGLMMKDESARVSSPGNTPLSDDDVKVRIDSDCHVVLDGKEIDFDATASGAEPPAASPDPVTEDFILDASAMAAWNFAINNNGSSNKRARTPGSDFRANKRHKSTGFESSQSSTWTILRGQWRLRVQPRSSAVGDVQEGLSMEVVMEGVKIEGVSGEKAGNARRGFLE